MVPEILKVDSELLELLAYSGDKAAEVFYDEDGDAFYAGGHVSFPSFVKGLVQLAVNLSILDCHPFDELFQDLEQIKRLTYHTYGRQSDVDADYAVECWSDEEGAVPWTVLRL